MWRCPHCGTPQAETARCWVCHRSSTACATCRNYRRSVAGPLGYCGLDRQRQPLRGDEIRACWEASAAPSDPPDVGAARRSFRTPSDVDDDRTPVRRLEFVEVRPQRRRRPDARPQRAGSAAPMRLARQPSPRRRPRRSVPNRAGACGATATLSRRPGPDGRGRRERSARARPASSRGSPAGSRAGPRAGRPR